MPFYLTPKQDDFNQIPELQVCIAEALYDADSIVADPEAYTKEELAALRSQRLFFFRNTPGNYSRDQQEQSHEKQIFGITPSDATIVCRNNDKNLEAVDEVAFTTDGFGISDSRNHQKRKHEHADRQVHV